MSQEFNRGIALGIIGSYFLVGPILGVIKLSSVEIYVTIVLAAYLFFKN